MTHFASQVKVDWSPDPDGLISHAKEIAERVVTALDLDGIEDIPCLMAQERKSILRTLSPDCIKLLLRDSISPLPLHKSLALLEILDSSKDDRYHRHEMVALARALVYSISNLHFGPEVGAGPMKDDSPVLSPWLANVREMAEDIRSLQAGTRDTPSIVHNADSRQITGIIQPNSVDAVITSPPYPNEKDYTRTTRLESVLLGFINDKTELRQYKQKLMRSNTRNVYKDDDDDIWVAGIPEIQRIADEIEARRIELGKTSGFERMYSRVTKLYFGGMARHLADLRQVLRPGAHLAYVVGDQASYLRVMIRTGQLLADIGASLGYEVVGIDLFRTRLSTVTKEQLREEVVVLRWPG